MFPAVVAESSVKIATAVKKKGINFICFDLVDIYFVVSFNQM